MGFILFTDLMKPEKARLSGRCDMRFTAFLKGLPMILFIPATNSESAFLFAIITDNHLNLFVEKAD